MGRIMQNYRIGWIGGSIIFQISSATAGKEQLHMIGWVVLEVETTLKLIRQQHHTILCGG